MLVSVEVCPILLGVEKRLTFGDYFLVNMPNTKYMLGVWKDYVISID